MPKKLSNPQSTLKKRILQFIGSFHQGGSERHAVTLTRLLKNEGSFEVFAATLSKGGALLAEAESIGLRAIPEFPLTSFYNANFVRQVRSCAKYLRENKIDVVHTHDFYTNVFGMAASSLAGVPVRITSRRETTGIRSGAQQFVEKLAFGRSSVIIANCNAVRDHLIARSISPDKIRVIHNGIDVDRFATPGQDNAASRLELGLPADGNIRFVTIVANLRHDVKNVPMLLRAALRVVESDPNIHFVLAGEGPLGPQLNETAMRMGLADQVHFIGTRRDVPSLLAISAVCTLTSRAEGFSNSILEYMAAGRPVVATDVGGASEAIIEGETGYLVPTDDDQTLAVRLLEILRDEQTADEFGARGRAVVAERFSLDTLSASHLDLYRSLVN